jgi:hypothetical protein
MNVLVVIVIALLIGADVIVADHDQPTDLDGEVPDPLPPAPNSRSPPTVQAGIPDGAPNPGKSHPLTTRPVLDPVPVRQPNASPSGFAASKIPPTNNPMV